ncbi:biotin transporter BioY [Brevibacterium daeguense]|uniref:Biotin transporter n=1 Tax=Brevibacterium daeguense TaxID=909936 RepID=A0ABP8EGA2_9MICO|nr:biotin transporter BioY [Brevibacterium daeguense]
MSESVSTASSPAPAAAARSAWRAVDLALIAVFAALIAVLAAMPPIPVGTVGVPITLQTLGIALCGMVLGPWRGLAAAGLYVVLGLIGLPIFAGFNGGLGVLAGPSAGYLLSFPIFALACGFVAAFAVRRFAGGRLWLVLALGGLAASFLTNHPLGIVGMSINADLTLQQALFADMPFWPGDIVKNIVAAFLAVMVHRAFPQILRRR